MPETGTVTDIFISHVEEDSAAALQISDALEAAGYSTWCYERDSVPGPSYLLQTADAIDRSKAVVVIVSPHSLGSHQMTKELVRGQQGAKPFVPVMISMSRAKFAARQPEWIEAIGNATSIEVPRGGLASVLPRIVAGIEALDFEASGEPGRQVDSTAFISAVPRRRALLVWQKAAIGGLAVAVVAGVAALLFVSGNGSSRTSSRSTVDVASTPLETAQGQAKITDAHLAKKFCYPNAQEAAQAESCTEPTSGYFLVLSLEAWKNGSPKLTTFFGQEFYDQAFQSYLVFDGRTFEATTVDVGNFGAAVVYDKIPPSAAGNDVNLIWPTNTAFILQLS